MVSRLSFHATGATAALVLALGALARPAAAAPEAVRVELLTMGRGEDLYTRFGHAAFRVRGGGHDDAVYNYGYTDFGAPGLIFDFLRGKARFWVVADSYAATVRYYRRENRGIRRIPLNLTDAQHRALASRLARNLLPENRTYTYHHYLDNCTTRLRDLLDDVTGGAVERQLRGRPTGYTFRDLTREGFAGRLEVLALSELLLGRALDRPVDAWTGGFLPMFLEPDLGKVQVGGRSLLGPVDVLHRRVGPEANQGNPLAGVTLLGLTAGGLALLGALALYLARKRSRWTGLCLVPSALLVGLNGLLVWSLVLFVKLPEIRENELALLLWPTDLLLLWPAVRLLRGRLFVGALLRGYLKARLAGVALLLLGHAVGLLHQEPRLWLLFGLALVPGWLCLLRLPRTLEAEGPLPSATAVEA
ncbi:MAG: DUF4105 domain-containing protein [Deltaproteobacteria bacterium]|nr:DUF4105 domain-containing protein [Deltaproteobacteria bacterium]